MLWASDSGEYHVPLQASDPEGTILVYLMEPFVVNVRPINNQNAIGLKAQCTRDPDFMGFSVTDVHKAWNLTAMVKLGVYLDRTFGLAELRRGE